MRKAITIVGVGRRMAGIGKKSGVPYDFTPLSFTFDDPKFTGVTCATVNVSQENLNGATPAVGDVLEAVMHQDYSSGRLYVDAIL